MNKYEVVYIIDPAVEDEARKALIAKFNDLITGNGGSVDKVEEWGKRFDLKAHPLYAELPEASQPSAELADGAKIA